MTYKSEPESTSLKARLMAPLDTPWKVWNTIRSMVVSSICAFQFPVERHRLGEKLAFLWGSGDSKTPSQPHTIWQWIKLALRFAVKSPGSKSSGFHYHLAIWCGSNGGKSLCHDRGNPVRSGAD